MKYLLPVAAIVVAGTIEIKVVAELMHHFQGQAQFYVAAAVNDRCYSKVRIMMDSIMDLNQPNN